MDEIESNDEYFDEHYLQILYAHRRDLIITRQSLNSEYTKSLIALSGGAIGLSLSLISGIFGTKFTSTNFTLLYIAWILWGICIILVLVSLRSGQKSFENDIIHLDKEIHERKSITYSAQAGKSGTISDCSEIIAGILFFIGIIVFIIFVVNKG